jgi:hypothetical protein
MKWALIGFFCLTLAGCALFERGNTVRVANTADGYELLLNDKPFYIQGAGVGQGVVGRLNYLALAREMGANTVRTWGTDQGTKAYLDEAHRQGLYVAAGIWIRYADENKTVSYLGGDEAEKKEKETLDYVRRFKRHPAILAWNIGNECIFFTKDPAEREALCRFLEQLIQKVKKEDPNHPVLYTSVNSLDLPYLKKYVPSLDIIGMNVYGSVIGSQSGWQALDFGKPYVITEFGPLGPWDLPKDLSGKMSEQADYTKAQQYKNHWSLIRERRGKNVGGFAFHIGETTQESLTQWNLNDYENRREAFVVMQKLYGAGDASDHAPRITTFTVPQVIAPGAEFEVELIAKDPEGSLLSYEFKASTTIQDVLQYYVNQPVPIKAHVGEGPKHTLVAPSKPGIYRIYGFARDQSGRSSSASQTLTVQ